MPVATPLLRRPAPPTTKPPLVLQPAYGVGYGGKEEREKKKGDVGRMRARFTIRHRVMCARFCVCERGRRERKRERGMAQRKIRGCLEKRRRIENGRNDCLTSPFGLNASHFLRLACFVSCRKESSKNVS